MGVITAYRQTLFLDLKREMPRQCHLFSDHTSQFGTQRRIRDPRILILDDASSALDFRTDAALRKGLREAFPQTTRLIVSQRAGTLCACDRILVMQDGVCVGFDTHARLYDDCAVYRGICQTQGVSREGVSA